MIVYAVLEAKAIQKSEMSHYEPCIRFVCVVENKELADRLAKEITEGNTVAWVEECDTEHNPSVLKFKHCYDVSFNDNFQLNYVYENKLEYSWNESTTISYYRTEGYCVEYVFADNEETAIKIAKDKLAQYIDKDNDF